MITWGIAVMLILFGGLISVVVGYYLGHKTGHKEGYKLGYDTAEDYYKNCYWQVVDGRITLSKK